MSVPSVPDGLTNRAAAVQAHHSRQAHVNRRFASHIEQRTRRPRPHPLAAAADREPDIKTPAIVSRPCGRPSFGSALSPAGLLHPGREFPCETWRRDRTSSNSVGCKHGGEDDQAPWHASLALLPTQSPQNRSPDCTTRDASAFHERPGRVEIRGAGDLTSASARRTARAAAPRPDPAWATEMQKRGAGSSDPSSRSDSRDGERARDCPRNRSAPRHDGARWSASRSLACRANEGRRLGRMFAPL